MIQIIQSEEILIQLHGKSQLLTSTLQSMSVSYSLFLTQKARHIYIIVLFDL